VDSQVLFVSGHRTDNAGRIPARFPEGQVDVVRAAIAAWFQARGVGPGWTLITGGARGADLIAAEEALRLKAGVHLYLASDESTFIEQSVRDGSTSAQWWEDSFRRVRSRASIDRLDGATPFGLKDAPRYARANDWMLAVLEAADSPHALLVWDGDSGLPGGAGEVATRARQIVESRGGCMHVIDPTPTSDATTSRES